jgi:hypothetical protein
VTTMGVLLKGQKVETSKRKRKRNKGAAEGSTSSPAVKVLQRMSDNMSRIQEKKEEHN